MTDFTQIPFNKIIKFGQKTMLDEDLFSISWILGRFCNYSCSYCWPYAHSSQIDHQSIEVYLRTIDSIKEQANSNGFTNFHWSFMSDGSYDITLDLISSGDVIESLKVNALIEDAGGSKVKATKSESDDDKPSENDNEIITYYATKHSIGQFFWFLRYQIDFIDFGKVNNDQTLYKTFSFTDYTTTPEEQNSNIEVENLANTAIKIGSPVAWGLAALSNWAFDTEFLVNKPPLPVGIDKNMFLK